MAHEAGSDSPIALLATGELRVEESHAWKLFEASWGVLERFVRVRLITCGLREKLLDDCGQEVFTRVWRFRTSYRGTTEAEFWCWLRQICDNERRRILSREAARATGPLPELEQEDAGRARMASSENAFNTSVLNENLAGLRACLQHLETRHRQVIELAYFDPMLPERSIAELLGCSASNVHKLKVEGLRFLQACLVRKGLG